MIDIWGIPWMNLQVLCRCALIAKKEINILAGWILYWIYIMAGNKESGPQHHSTISRRSSIVMASINRTKWSNCQITAFWHQSFIWSFNHIMNSMSNFVSLLYVIFTSSIVLKSLLHFWQLSLLSCYIILYRMTIIQRLVHV